ncbi:MAG: hypothetical protein L3J26_07085 [Candidatus Polarisedimenticolaceae bacterium]|nr:hypothetical protein [Candidatus Polarisedimenticolaceae bacterium]
MAIREIQRIITFKGRTVVIDADIRSYFDRIPQKPLMNLVKRRITPCVRIVVASNFQLEESRNEKKLHKII